MNNVNHGSMAIPVQYDYIIAGAGCAGLSLAMHLIHSGAFRDKKILLIDQDGKKSNDRTWCFWEEGESIFEPVVRHSWNHIQFFGNQRLLDRNLGTYQYKMIRGIDFYQHCLDTIAQQPNFEFRKASVDHVFSTEWSTGIISGNQAIHAHYVFNSILFARPNLSEKQY